MSARFKWLIGIVLAAGVGVYFLVWNKKSETPRDEPVGFREMASEAGIKFHMNFLPDEQGETFKINLYDHGCGIAVADFDGDGHDDIYLVNQLGPNALFRNRGDGTFEDVTAKAKVAIGDRICVGATFADTRNNGLQDLFVTSTRGGNVFFRNQGDGTFKDETKKAGLTHVGHSQTAVFFDFDNDGYLDLLVTNTAQWTTNEYDKLQKYFRGGDVEEGIFKMPVEANILYRNNGDGTFTNVTAKAGLTGPGWSGDVAVFDYNDDGYPDLLITNMFGPSQLFRNNKNGTFTDVTWPLLGPTSFGSIGAKAFDFNNDGKLDLLLVAMHSDMWMGPDFDHWSLNLAKEGEKKKYSSLAGPTNVSEAAKRARNLKVARGRGYKLEEVVYGNTFFKNLGGDKFQEISDKANMENFWPWGIATGDFNNDGFEDVFITAGMGYPFYYWPNYLMMNNGDETFTNKASETGIEPPKKGEELDLEINGRIGVRSSRCAAVADFDGDGRLDIIVNNFNHEPYYFRNTFPRHNYIAFRLRGTKSNRDAIGALVTLHMTKKDGTKEIMLRQVNPAGGYLSQSSKTIHFGLGDRPKVDRAVIRWPSGIRQQIESPAINQLHKDIREPDKQ